MKVVIDWTRDHGFPVLECGTEIPNTLNPACTTCGNPEQTCDCAWIKLPKNPLDTLYACTTAGFYSTRNWQLQTK